MFHSINPVDNQVLKSFPTLNNEELRAKLLRSKLAYDDWKAMEINARIQQIQQIRNDLKENSSKYARLITLEMGKPIAQSRTEIEKCIFLCDYYAKNASTFLKGKVIETNASRSYVIYQPLGAVLGIMPWNFPFWQVFRFAIPTILAGNVVLLKHAPNVPQCALIIEKIFEKATETKGVFQSLFIEIEQVETVIANEIVQGVTLTGSDLAGSSVAALAGKHIKKCVLELGGTDAFIVLKDADLEKAAHFAIKSRMNNCGQTCISAKRIIVHESIASQFTDLLLNEITKLKIGDPFEEKTNLSCLARLDLVENLDRQISSSIADGAVEKLKGGRITKGSNFYKPVLLTNINAEMAVYKEEVFGPVAIVIPFKNESEAIQIANDSKYGLGAAVWSKNLEKAEKMGLALEAGAIAINNMLKSDPRLPFGGVKRSGFGRELSIEGIKAFVNVKSFFVNESN